jgi:mannonate dehydratase
MNRRRFVKFMGLGLTAGAIGYYWPDEGVTNPCYTTQIPEELVDNELVARAWEGVDANKFWDMHTHLIGTGDSADSGIYMHPSMQDIFSPAQYLRYQFYINASCANKEEGIDKGFVNHVHHLLNAFPSGAKCMLLAFDFNYTADGLVDKESSPFYTPNNYARRIAASRPDRFEWIASIHPYREDCVEALNQAVKDGARAIKWLPGVMGINPASEKCDRMYEAMAKTGMPLLTHAGDEHAVDGVQAQMMGNPLLLRRALEHGVKVIIAHCASEGTGIDVDKGENAGRLTNFELFTRMMDDKRYEDLLFGEISAMTQLNRVGPALQTVLTREDWHHRLLNGSDYPLPGVMPLYSTEKLYQLGYIPQKDVQQLRELRQHNPLLFDFVLKRSMSWQGKRFATSIFETSNMFLKNRQPV